MESAENNMKFVLLIEENKIILRKSQNPRVKKVKREALAKVIEEWKTITGKTLNEESFMKKLSNLKVRTTLTVKKGLELADWQQKLLELTKNTQVGDQESTQPMTIQVEAPMVIPVSAPIVLHVPTQNPSIEEGYNLKPEDILNEFESSQSKLLNNKQLERLVLLKQLKLVELQHKKMERELQLGAPENIDFEFIQWEGMNSEENIKL